MSDLKFTCASCGQHIQCDQDYANERIPCPNCGTVVRVPVDAPIVPHTPAPAAAPPAPTATNGLEVPTLEENFSHDSGAAVPSTPPLTEREQQIAAARAAHPVLPTPPVKPRLSYILNGGVAPPPAENDHATHPEQKAPEECPHTKSFHE